MAYNYIAGIDDANQFPPVVRQATADSPEIQGTYARMVGGVLSVGGVPVGMPGSPAALNTAGWCRAVFIPKGGTIPVGTPTYTLVIEADA